MIDCDLLMFGRKKITSGEWKLYFFFLCDDRAPITRDFHGNYDSGEEWNGYISDNDRVLLKVVCIIWLLCCLNF